MQKSDATFLKLQQQSFIGVWRP